MRFLLNLRWILNMMTELEGMRKILKPIPYPHLLHTYYFKSGYRANNWWPQSYLKQWGCKAIVQMAGNCMCRLAEKLLASNADKSTVEAGSGRNKVERRRNGGVSGQWGMYRTRWDSHVSGSCPFSFTCLGSAAARWLIQIWDELCGQWRHAP